MGIGHDHHHHHHDEHAHPTPQRALLVAVLLNGAFLVLELALGYLSGSLALLSDAGHMFSDVGALLLALFAFRLSGLKPSPSYTFGLRRLPVLGALINAATLVAIVVSVTVEAIGRLLHPPPIEAGLVLITGVAGLAVNLISAWYLARSRDTSVNTRGAMLHLLGDALGSVAAIVSALVVYAFGLTIADPIASLVIAALILLGSLPLLRDTTNILLQRAPAGFDIEGAYALLAEHPKVGAVSDFHVWSLDSDPLLSAVLTVQADRLTDATELADMFRDQLLERFGIEHATLECRCPDTPPAKLPEGY